MRWRWLGLVLAAGCGAPENSVEPVVEAPASDVPAVEDTAPAADTVPPEDTGDTLPGEYIYDEDEDAGALLAPDEVSAALTEAVGACLTDRQADGLSMIYSFFAADIAERPGLGNFIIMDHIARAREAGLAYVYLGYWIRGSRRMAYKVRYRPIEVLGPAGWRRMNDAELAHSERESVA